MTLFSDKMIISHRCIRGLMPNLIKKSWTVSNQGIFPKASIHENLPADFEVVWQQIAFSSDLAPIRAKLSLCTNGVGRDHGR